MSNTHYIKRHTRTAVFNNYNMLPHAIDALQTLLYVLMYSVQILVALVLFAVHNPELCLCITCCISLLVNYVLLTRSCHWKSEIDHLKRNIDTQRDINHRDLEFEICKEEFKATTKDFHNLHDKFNAQFKNLIFTIKAALNPISKLVRRRVQPSVNVRVQYTGPVGAVYNLV